MVPAALVPAGLGSAALVCAALVCPALVCPAFACAALVCAALVCAALVCAALVSVALVRAAEVPAGTVPAGGVRVVSDSFGGLDPRAGGAGCGLNVGTDQRRVWGCVLGSAAVSAATSARGTKSDPESETDPESEPPAAGAFGAPDSLRTARFGRSGSRDCSARRNGSDGCEGADDPDCSDGTDGFDGLAVPGRPDGRPESASAVDAANPAVSAADSVGADGVVWAESGSPLDGIDPAGREPPAGVGSFA